MFFWLYDIANFNTGLLHQILLIDDYLTLPIFEANVHHTRITHFYELFYEYLFIKEAFNIILYKSSLYLNASTLFSILFFFTFFNIWLILSATIFVISLIPNFNLNSNSKNRLSTYWFVISASSLLRLILSFIFLVLLLLNSISSSELTFIYSSFLFTDFQLKYLYFNLPLLTVVILGLLSSAFFSTQNNFEFLFFVINLNLWLISLIFSNNLLIFIFSVEILSTVNFVLFILSVFSRSYFFNLNDLDDFKYFNNTKPSLYIQTLIYIYWIGLIGSLLLFLFLVLLYKLTLTLDFYLLVYLYEWYFFNLDFSIVWFVNFSLIWLFFLVIVFLKCAIFPFFFWKPSLFKGLPLYTILVYITLYFFSLFLYFLYFLLVYLPSALYFLIIELYILIFIGLLFLTLSVLDSYFFKTFFALSSSINTLFILIITLAWSSENSLLYI